MKLSEYVQEISRAYDALLLDISLQTMRHEFAFNYKKHHLNHILPREHQHSTPPKLPRQYDPIAILWSTEFQNKEKLVLLSALQATYQDTTTPITPDMVPLILDTGPSITISPFKSDFVSKIKPVQQVKIQGIAAGLTIKGIGDLSYSFYNDHGVLQTLHLRDCLYIPTCSVRLLCPHQISNSTNCFGDGFNALSHDPILTDQGKQTTIKYYKLSKLPLLFTTLGISSYQQYISNIRELKADPSATPTSSTWQRNKIKNYTSMSVAHMKDLQI